MATKPAVKTYSKTYTRDTAASKAFDDALKPNSAGSKAALQTKWGKTSFSRVREDDPFEVTCKKVKIETESTDPFSFDFDDDGTVKKEPPAPTNVPPPSTTSTAGLGRPAIPNIKVTQKVTETRAEGTEEEEDNVPLASFKNRPVRTYSRKKGEETETPVNQDQNTEIKEESETPDRPKRNTNRDVFADSPERELEETVITEENPKRKTTRTYTRRKGQNNVPRMITSKTHVLHSEEDSEEGLTVLNFRSHYMDPAVYSQFKYKPHNDDPVGRLNNSRVLQKSEIKHGKGSTVIVVCSPKVPPVPGLKSYLKEKPRGPKASDDDTSSLSQVSNLADAAELTKQEIQTLNKNSSAFDLTEENSDNFTMSAPVPPRQFARKTKSSIGAGVRVNRIFKSKNRSLPQNEDEEMVKEDTPPPSLENVSTPPPPLESMPMEVEAKPRSRKKGADNSFGFDSGEESDSQMPDIIGKPVESMEMSQGTDTSTIENSQETSIMDFQESPAEELNSSQDLLSSSQSSVGDSSQDSAKAVQPVREKKIFRSKNSRLAELQKKTTLQKSPSKAVYNVRSWQADIDEEERKKREAEGPPTLTPAVAGSIAKKATGSRESSPAEMPHLVRAVHWPNKDGDDAYTSVHVHKEHKELYTVVKNVKEAHECQEHGETQEFSDDIEYLLAGLKEGEPMSTRCLSCIGLAQKCILPAFRMHLRAHGTVSVIFGNLHDAASDPSLALCTALLMFMLSRDRLNMDLEKSSLNLMLRLLEVDNQDRDGGMTAAGKRALNRNIERAKEVYFQLQKETGTENQPDLETVSTGNLAMESLLSLTSLRAGEWFKEELRTLGALDHIVDTVCTCIQAIGDDTTLLYDSTLENIKKTDRCLRVLENVIFVNTENQTYLLSYKSGIIGSSCCRALQICQKFLPIYPLPDGQKLDKESYGYVVYNCVLAILKVLLNLTHENEFACTKVGEQEDFINTVLTAILQTPQYVPQDLRYDILILGLGLLINLVEHCDINRRKVIDAKTHRSFEFDCLGNKELVPASQALVQVFCKRFETAKTMEEQDFSSDATTPQHSPNKSGEWKESESGMEWVVNSSKKNKDNQKTNGDIEDRLKPNKENDLADEETFAKALHKAGKHMENSIVASYIALLLGCVIQDNTVFVGQVKEHLPSGNFEDMIMMLKKFLSFMNLTTAIGSSGGKSIGHVIEVLESC